MVKAGKFIRNVGFKMFPSSFVVLLAVYCSRKPAGEAVCGTPPSALSTASESAATRSLNVFVREGLILREAPSREAKKLALIPFGTTVCVTRTNEAQKKITVRGISGEFVATTYEGLRGYIFDGFLSKLPAPASPDYSLGEYLRKAFGPIAATEWLRTDLMRDSVIRRSVAHYKKEIQVMDSRYAGGASTMVIFPEKYEVRDIYLLCFPGEKTNAIWGDKYTSPPFETKKPDYFHIDMSHDGASEYVQIQKKNKKVYLLLGGTT